MQESGKNLLEQAFEQVTDEQITAYHLRTGKQRTPALAAGASVDSTQIASNIRSMSRLQLLVEVLQRVHRMLTEEDQGHYAEVFAPYIQGHAGQYVYHLKGQDTREHLQKIGELTQHLRSGQVCWACWLNFNRITAKSRCTKYLNGSLASIFGWKKRS